jgi:hypothetical protein
VHDYAQFAQTSQDSASGRVDECGPKSPDSHRVVWGLTRGLRDPRRAFLRFPVCPPGSSPLRPPSSGLPSSGVLRFVPFGRCPIPVPVGSLRVPFYLSRPYGSAAAGPLRRRLVPDGKDQGHEYCRDPAGLDRAIGQHSRWPAAGHDEMPRQNRLLRAAASARHRRARTAQIGSSWRTRTQITLRDGRPDSRPSPRAGRVHGSRVRTRPRAPSHNVLLARDPAAADAWVLAFR